MRLALLMPIGFPWARRIALELVALGQSVFVIDFANANTSRAYLSPHDDFRSASIASHRSATRSPACKCSTPGSALEESLLTKAAIMTNDVPFRKAVPAFGEQPNLHRMPKGMEARVRPGCHIARPQGSAS